MAAITTEAIASKPAVSKTPVKRWKKLAAASVLAATLAGGEVAPALADSTNLSGTVCTCGSTTTYNTIRTATSPSFVLDLSNKTATNLTISHLNTGSNTVFGGATFTGLQSRTTATNVNLGRRFKMRARMVAQTGQFADNTWGGNFHY